ncbi:MAG: LytTR family DNA-binding domain-containing protein [Candidatus Ventricola sp.]
MKITVCPGAEEELIVRCPDPDAPNIRALMRLLGDAQRRIPARLEQQLCFLSPADILYAECVDRSVFLYTADQVYATPLTLAQLEDDALVRCAKSMVVRIGAIRALRSQTDGRILATLTNGEQLYISRRYAAALRRALG